MNIRYALFCCFLVLFGCSDDNVNITLVDDETSTDLVDDETSTDLVDSDTNPTLSDEAWVLLEYGYDFEEKTSLIDGTSHTIEFDSDFNTVEGSVDCNSFQSDFTVSDNELSISTVALTEIICDLSGEAYTEQFNFIVSALENVSTYDYSDANLVLTSVSGKQLVYELD